MPADTLPGGEECSIYCLLKALSPDLSCCSAPALQSKFLRGEEGVGRRWEAIHSVQRRNTPWGLGDVIPACLMQEEEYLPLNAGKEAARVRREMAASIPLEKPLHSGNTTHF